MYALKNDIHTSVILNNECATFSFFVTVFFLKKQHCWLAEKRRWLKFIIRDL